MNQITTKTGDTGTTSLRGGIRVEKDDLRIEVNGLIDELNATLGMTDPDSLTADIQRELMTIMSHIATPDGQQNPRTLHVVELTQRMEERIAAAAKPQAFVVPQGGGPRGWLHIARTKARTVERRLWTLSRQHHVASEIMVFMNRLSDYLFVRANEANQNGK